METFKKGQIIPKRINIVGVNKSRFRHLFTFGCDVIVDRNEISYCGNGPAIYVRNNHIGGKKGKPKEYIRAVIGSIVATRMDSFPIVATASLSYSSGEANSER